MLNLCLVLILSASVFSESVRETETWMPMKTTQTDAMRTQRDDAESSGSDFGFIDDVDEDGYNKGQDDEDEDDYNTDTLYDDEDDYDEISGSGDGATTASPEEDSKTSAEPDFNDNKIPEVELPARPTASEEDLVINANKIPLLRNEATPDEEHPSNVLMSHASEDSIFSKKEVIAALIAGSAVGLTFAVLLIMLLVYCMKKKDEGSYDLGKKPIYKKAPTTEIYA